MLLLISCGDKKEYNVLVIQSYEPEFTSYDFTNRLIEEEFKRNDINANITTLYLDCERYILLEEMDIFNNYLDSINKSGNIPDVILVNDDQATYALLKTANPVVKRVPVVFFGVNHPDWELIGEYENVTGFWDKPDYVQTVRMAEHLFGNVRVTYLSDITSLGKIIEDEMKRQLVGTNIAYRSRHSLAQSDLRTDVLESRTRPDSLTIYDSSIRYIKGEATLWLMSGIDNYRVFLFTKRDLTTVRMGAYSNYSSFTSINEGMGFGQGILAGYIAPLETEINHAVLAASKILKGIPVSDLPISQIKKSYVIDRNEMPRWNINKENIPSEWNIINISFVDKYRKLFVILFVSTILISIITIVLMVLLLRRANNRKRKVLEDLDWKNKFLSLALESGNIFAWKYDAIRKELTFDKEFFEYLKLDPVKYFSTQIHNIIHPDDYDKTSEILNNHIECVGKKTIFKIRVRFSGEKYYWWEFRCSPVILKDDGKETIVAGLCLSIQEYKDREEELIEARDLAAKAELKESFLANMSHEIRTPLNAIVGFSNLIVEEEGFSKEERAEFIDSINKNCEMLLKLINDILEISRIESGNMSFKFEDICLKELLNDVYTTHMFLVPENVKLIKNEPDEDIIINTDKVRLAQVITNFINNAAKFTLQGHIIIGYKVSEATLKSKKRFRELLIYVEDTGRGIPKDQQRMIFNRFYKQDEFAQGTGLGLSICNVIVQRFGGYITIDSEVGKGSCFTIHIPFEGKCHIVGEVECIDNSEVVDNDKQTGFKNKKKFVILIAEDQESNYLLVKSILQDDYELIRVINGEGVIRMMHSRDDIGLILMDVRMTGMNGIEATQIIHEEFPDIPIIIHTAYAFEYDIQKAWNAGCADFIAKPVIPAILKEKIRKLI